MFESGAFGYVNVLSSAADAAWTRNEILNNNIANVDTPGFKRQDMRSLRAFCRMRLQGRERRIPHLTRRWLMSIIQGLSLMYIQIIHSFQQDLMEIMWILMWRRLNLSLTS